MVWAPWGDAPWGSSRRKRGVRRPHAATSSGPNGMVRNEYRGVVCGLARGIDGIAHRAALKAGGRTLAVLAGGLSRIYPPEHADLANEVAAAGALLTEAP